MITKQFDKNGEIEYVVATRYQDCTEYSRHRTEAEARKNYRLGEKLSRNLKDREIRDPIIRDHTVDPVVRTDDRNVLEWEHDKIGIAMDLAMRRLPARPNKTYRLKIALEEIEQGFVGEGI